MERESLDSFLKRRAPTPPSAPLGEKQRIWRAIENAETRAPWWNSLMFARPRQVVPIALALALAGGILLQRHRQRNAEIDRVLSAALMYQIEDEEPAMF